ncbi:MAG: hypothetical protein MPK03_07475, partial [Alphaproteobacteria bacterium]|nr:hypothetical protein [Alphaproteobacteria bacterium]
TDARGRCPQKNKFALSLIRGTIDDHHGEKPLALVGGVFRHLRCRLKRAMPTDACRRCRQKINSALLIKGQTTITVPISQSLALAGVYLDL